MNMGNTLQTENSDFFICKTKEFNFMASTATIARPQHDLKYFIMDYSNPDRATNNPELKQKHMRTLRALVSHKILIS